MKGSRIQLVIFVAFVLGIAAEVKSQNFLYTRYQDLEGNQVTLDEIKGQKLTILDFWATWCKPCVKSIPEMVDLAREYQGEEVIFVGVNVDSPRNLSKVRPFANSYGINYKVILDTDQEIMRELVVSVLPTFVILDENGKVLYFHEGYLPGDEEILKDKLEELLSHAE